MGTADQLLEQMFSWIEKKERCADNLMKLAQKLESRREKCNVGECVGSTVAVVGSLCTIGAGVVTILTGGAAAPLFLAGAAYTGTGVAVSVGTKITEHFLSSGPLKEAKEVEKESDEILSKIQKLFEKLKAEKKGVRSFADPEELHKCINAEIITAIARRDGLKAQFNNEPPVKLHTGNIFSDERQFIWSRGHRGLSQDAVKMNFQVGLVLGSFLLVTLPCVKRKGAKMFANLGAKALTTYGLKSGMKKGPLVVGGAAAVTGVVGLTFALSEAIEKWTDLIENNHVTEASQSLRDTAHKLRNAMRTLRKQFNNIREMLKKMAEDQRKYEEQLAEQRRNQERERLEREKQERGKQKSFWFMVISVGIICYALHSKYSAVHLPGQQVSQASRESQTDQRHEHRQDDVQFKEKKNQEEQERDRQRDRKKTDNSRFALLNCRSINNKNIIDFLMQTQLDVLIIPETWLRNRTGDEVLQRMLQATNYRFCHWARMGRGGGVAVIFTEAMQGQQIHFKPTETFEHVAVELQHTEWDTPILVIAVYRPPGGNLVHFGRFLDELEMLLYQASVTYDRIIVTGDFNIHVDNERMKKTLQFQSLLDNKTLTQHVTGPTHERNRTLDLVISSENVKICNVMVQNDNISDHCTVYFSARPLSHDSEENRADKDENEDEDEDEQTKRFKSSEE